MRILILIGCLILSNTIYADNGNCLVIAKISETTGKIDFPGRIENMQSYSCYKISIINSVDVFSGPTKEKLETVITISKKDSKIDNIIIDEIDSGFTYAEFEMVLNMFCKNQINKLPVDVEVATSLTSNNHHHDYVKNRICEGSILSWYINKI